MFHVVDSTPGTTASALKDNFGDLAEKHDVDVWGASADETRAFAARIAKAAGLDSALLTFALSNPFRCGLDTGANRNALLLANAGRAFLSADDDTICEVSSAPIHAEGALSWSWDPTSVNLVDGTGRESPHPTVGDESVFTMHSRLLGRRFFEVTSPSSCLVGEEFHDRSMLDALFVRAHVPIAATVSGFAGDCGVRYPSFYLWGTNGPAAQLSTCNEDQYRQLVRARQIERFVTRPTVSGSSFLMSTHLAIDARNVFPPFFPILRGQDLIVGRLIRHGLGGFIGHVPLMVRHVPVESRRADLDHLWPGRKELSFSSVMLACLAVATRSLAAVPGERRMREVGKRLQEMASLDRPTWAEIIGTELKRQTTAWLAAHEKLLNEHRDDNTAWARGLSNMAAEQRVRLQRRPHITPIDVAPAAGLSSEDICMLIVRRYGQLLEIWPAVMRAAESLRRSGGGLFKE